MTASFSGSDPPCEIVSGVFGLDAKSSGWFGVGGREATISGDCALVGEGSRAGGEGRPSPEFGLDWPLVTVRDAGAVGEARCGKFWLRYLGL